MPYVLWAFDLQFLSKVLHFCFWNCQLDYVLFSGMCLTLETSGVPKVILHGPPCAVCCFRFLVILDSSVHYFVLTLVCYRQCMTTRLATDWKPFSQLLNILLAAGDSFDLIPCKCGRKCIGLSHSRVLSAVLSYVLPGTKMQCQIFLLV